MAWFLVVLSSFARSVEAQHALHLARVWHGRRATVDVLLLQDAVLAVVGNRPTCGAEDFATLLSRGVLVYVCEHDLALRGFGPRDLISGTQAVSDRRMVDLMLTDDTRTLGCL